MDKPTLTIPAGWYTYRQMSDMTGKSTKTLSSAAHKGCGFERHQIKDEEGRIICTFVRKK